MLSRRIIIIRGGPSEEHEASLATGKNILRELSQSHSVVDVIVDKEGVWHLQGLPKKPTDICKHADVVVNTLRGTYGEDGKVQQILDNIGVPYTGSKSLASALSINKWKTKELFKNAGIKTPIAIKIYSNVDIEKQALDIFKTCTLPVILKPIASSSSIGVSICRDLKSIEEGLITVFSYAKTAIVEEFIKGKEATCVVVDNFRGQRYYAFPPIEIVKHSDITFDYDMKNGGKFEGRCPGHFSQIEKDAIMQAAINAHVSIGARHYSRSDFIIHPTRGVYILETNTTPSFTENSLTPKAVESVGSNTKDFLEHLIGLALE